MRKNVLEWGVFAFGLLAILAVVYGLIKDAGAPSGPPDLRVTADKPERLGDRYLVRVKVRNVGGEAAQAVDVRGEAGEQSAEFDLEYVPKGSEREGHLIFREEPRGLRVDAAGAAAP